MRSAQGRSMVSRYGVAGVDWSPEHRGQDLRHQRRAQRHRATTRHLRMRGEAWLVHVWIYRRRDCSAQRCSRWGPGGFGWARTRWRGPCGCRGLERWQGRRLAGTGPCSRDPDACDEPARRTLPHALAPRAWPRARPRPCSGLPGCPRPARRSLGAPFMRAPAAAMAPGDPVVPPAPAAAWAAAGGGAERVRRREEGDRMHRVHVSHCY